MSATTVQIEEMNLIAIFPCVVFPEENVTMMPEPVSCASDIEKEQKTDTKTVCKFFCHPDKPHPHTHYCSNMLNHSNSCGYCKEEWTKCPIADIDINLLQATREGHEYMEGAMDYAIKDGFSVYDEENNPVARRFERLFWSNVLLTKAIGEYNHAV